MTPRALLTMFVLFAACGPGSGVSEGSATGSVLTTGTTGTTGSTDGATSTTGTPTSTTDPTGTAASTATTTGDTSGLTGSTTTGTTTGGPIGGGACTTDDDCKLHDDCCNCLGVPIDADIAFCDLDCAQSKCSEYGIDAAVCRFGVCTTEQLSCDPEQVVCDVAPPDCGPEHLPETSPACWTGKCVPAFVCDVIPDCALCPSGTMCVTKFADAINEGPSCEPIPIACDGVVGCDCASELVCTGIYDLCSVAGAELECHCGAC